MQTTATNRKIRVILRDLDEGRLVPRPEFQRRLVWSNRHKQAFLDTILRGLPFPEIYVSAGDVDAETGAGTELLVDGQQRVTTLHQYFRGSPDLPLDGITAYVDLDKTAKLQFLQYEVVVRDLGQQTPDVIRDIFRRINSTQYALNAMELRNALFDGALKDFSQDVAEHSFFERHRVFRATEVRRMADLTFTLTIIVTMLSTYFNRDEELEPYLVRYNDEFEHRASVLGRLETAFRFIDACNFALRSRVWNKADLFTLLIEIDRLLNLENLSPPIDDVARRLKDFYSAVASYGETQKGGRAVAAYYRAAIQASNDRSSRIVRGEVLHHEIVRKVARPSVISSRSGRSRVI